jgi:heme/copper-type cytochrome/quinol oxidase subunit 2
MISDDDLKLGDIRLLSADNPLYLPSQTSIRGLVTSSDVIHS